jgi:hypothetical protein
LPDGSLIEVVTLGQLQVPSYQRGQVSSYRNIRNNFDINQFDVLTVCRRKDRSLWIVDGLQRYSARLDLTGENTPVFVRVVSGLDIAGEVALFERLNRNRVRVSSFAILSAQREAAEPKAVELFEVVESLGLKIGASHGAGVVGSPTQLIEIQQWPNGLVILREALSIVMDTWGKSHGAFHSTVVGGMCFFLRWSSEQDIAVPRRQLATKLRDTRFAIQPIELVNPAGIRGMSTKTGGSELAAARIARAWNAARKSGDRHVLPPENWAAVASTIAR